MNEYHNKILFNKLNCLMFSLEIFMNECHNNILFNKLIYLMFFLEIFMNKYHNNILREIAETNLQFKDSNSGT